MAGRSASRSWPTTDLPPWDNSAMDGYAVRAADVAAADEDRPVRLAIVGEVPAGGAPDRAVGPGTRDPDRDRCAAPARRRRGGPGRADHPARRGRCAASGVAGATRPGRSRRPAPSMPRSRAGDAIRRRGEDLRAGATVLEPGTRDDPCRRRARRRIRGVRRRCPPPAPGRGPGDRRRGPTAPVSRSVRPGCPTPTGRVCGRWRRRPGPTSVDLGIARDDLDDVLEPAPARASPRRTPSSSRAASRSGPYDVVKRAFETRRPDRPLAGGRPAGQAVRVRPGRVRCSCSACRATRSAAS